MSKYYLVILEDDGVDIKDIIHSPKRIIEFVDNERKTKEIKRRNRKNS